MRNRGCCRRQRALLSVKHGPGPGGVGMQDQCSVMGHLTNDDDDDDWGLRAPHLTNEDDEKPSRAGR